MGWTLPQNPTTITSLVSKSGSWVDLDLSTVVPAGTTTVIVEVTSVDGNMGWALRAKGSSDDRHAADTGPGLHCYAWVKLNSSRICQVWAENAARDLQWYLIGYTDEDGMPTDATQRVPGGAGSYYDFQAAVSGSACLVEVYGSSASAWAVRKKGDSHDHYYDYDDPRHGHVFCLVGVDGSDYWQGKLENTGKTNLWDQGTFANVKWLATPQDISPSPSSWTTVDITSYVGSDAGNVQMAIIGMVSASTGEAGLRPYGSSHAPSALDIYTGFQIWGYVGVDSSDRFEAMRESTNLTLYLYGYVSEPTGETYNESTSLDASAGIAPVGNISISAETTLTADSSVAPGGIMSALAAAGLSADAALAITNAAVMGAAIGLEAIAAIATAQNLGIPSSLSLSADAGISSIGGMAFEKALSLTADAGIAAAGGLAYNVATALQAAAALDPAGSKFSYGVVDLQSQAALIQQGNLILPCTLSLSSQAGVTPAGAADMADSLDLAAQVGFDTVALRDVTGAVTLTAGAAIDLGVLQELVGSLSLMAQAGIAPGSVMVMNDEVVLLSFAGIATAGSIAGEAETGTYVILFRRRKRD